MVNRSSVLPSPSPQALIPRVRVDGLWKRYGLPFATWWPLFKVWARGVLGRPSRDSGLFPWALQDISFELCGGETLGVIGSNGSGKSTLLKVIAGVSPASRGQAQTHGMIFPMIELNAGIHGDLSGRENIHILGAIMGLSRAHIHLLLPEIESFCELGPWFDRPVRTYSSGMLVRLGFAVGIHVHADILLMDEVMAVGDIHFHNKCMQQLEQLRDQGSAVMLVSHNMLRIRLMCDRVLVLDQGRQVFLGEVEKGIGIYEDLQQQRQLAQTITDEPGYCPTFGQKNLELTHVELRSPEGAGLESITQGEDVELHFTLCHAAPLNKLVINAALETREGVSAVWSALEVAELPQGESHYRVLWQDLRLRSGIYAVRIGVTSGPFNAKLMRSTGRIHLRVTGDEFSSLGLHTPRTRFIQVESPLPTVPP